MTIYFTIYDSNLIPIKVSRNKYYP